MARHGEAAMWDLQAVMETKNRCCWTFDVVFDAI
jgi:hypothetical protein